MMMGDDEVTEVTPQPTLFRAIAVDHHANGEQATKGDVLRISPSWTRWAYWLVLLTTIASVVFAAVVRLPQYATGPALVRIDGRTNIVARVPALVSKVEVRPGQRVEPGQLLVSFDVTEQEAELARTQREFDLLLLRVLREPTDQAARQALSALRAQRELAQARVDERAIRASTAGIVSDVRITAGRHLQTGEAVLSIVRDDARFFVEAMLPGHARPLIRPGSRLRLELTGYRCQYSDLVVTSVGDEVVGPTEVRRALTSQLGDAVQLSGPIVLVEAKLPAPTFVVDGNQVRFFEGMQGTADVVVRSESLLVTLVPALKVLHGLR